MTATEREEQETLRGLAARLLAASIRDAPARRYVEIIRRGPRSPVKQVVENHIVIDRL